MNNELQKYARDKIKKYLSQCTETQVRMFRSMYAVGTDSSISIEEVIDNIPEGKLDWCMTQCYNSLKKGIEKV